MGITQGSHLLNEGVRRHPHARNALDGFEDDGRDVLGRQGVLHSRHVPKGNEVCVRQHVFIRLAIGLSMSDGEAPQGPPVESLLHRHDAGPAGDGPGKLQRGLVGFRARVGKKDLGQSIGRECGEPLGRLGPHRVVCHIRIKEQLFGLRLHGLHDPRRRVAEQGHAVSPVEVEVSVALGIPDVAPFPSFESQGHLVVGWNFQCLLDLNRLGGSHWEC